MILTFLLMSFIVTYDISESNMKNYAFADILRKSGTVDVAQEEPLYSIKYDLEYSDVDYQSKTVNNDSLYEGQKKLVQKGEKGTRTFVYQKIFENEKFVSKSLEKIEYKEPVDEIVEVGTKKKVVTTSRGGFRYSDELVMTATAYDLSYESTGKNPGDPYYGITASGTKAQPGTVAVDPRIIPLGTKLYVASTDGSPDYGFATAEDTGGAIKGNKIDLFMNDSAACERFGRRPVKVYILH